MTDPRTIHSLTREPFATTTPNNHPSTLTQLEEELQFWRMEIGVLLQLLSKGNRKNLTSVEKNRIARLEAEFQLLQEKRFQAHGSELFRAEHTAKAELPTTVVTSHQRMRHVYQQLKSMLLPLLPKMVPVSIW